MFILLCAVYTMVTVTMLVVSYIGLPREIDWGLFGSISVLWVWAIKEYVFHGQH